MRFFKLRPMAALALAFFFCAVAATYVGRLVSVILAAAAGIVFLAALLIRRRTPDADARQARVALLSFLLAPVLAFSLAAIRGYANERAIPEGEDAAVTAVVRQRLGSSSGSAEYLLDVKSANGRGASFAACAFLSDLSFTPGDVIEATGTFSPVGTAYPDGERYLRSRGAIAEATLSAVRLVGEDRSPIYLIGILREKIGARIAGCMGDGAPLVTALVTGERGGLDPVLRRSFSELGISHLLALSGFHMSAAAGVAALIARPFGRRRYIAVIAAVACYAAISGFAASAVRAGTMMIAVCAAALIGRRTDGVSVAALAAAVITVVSPGAAWDLAFLLSVLSVLAISASPVTRREATGEKSAARRFAEYVGYVAFTTLAVSIVTLPVTAREFGVISLAAPLANMIFVPIVALIVYAAPVLLIASFVPYLGSLVGGALDLYASLVSRLAGALAGNGRFLVSLDRPGFAVMSIALSACFFALLIAKKRRVPAILSAIVLSAMILSGAIDSLARAGEFAAVMSAHDAGDLIAVTDGGGFYAVDAAHGSQSFVRGVVAAKRESGAVRVEKYVFTHLHSNSDVYLRELVRSVPVGEVALPEPSDADTLAVCERMAQIAADAGVRVTLWDGSTALGDAGLEISAPYDSPYSAEPTFALTLSLGERGATYLSAGYFDAPPEFRAEAEKIAAPDAVLGTHGPCAGGEPLAAGAFVRRLADGEVRFEWEKD